ncbi:MAG: hypothetical protein ACHQXA_06610, partial [Gemmatimonadales bacterium]
RPTPGILLALCLCGCAGPGRQSASFAAQVTSKSIRETLRGAGRTSWCRSRGVLLLEGSQGEDGVALVWYFGSALHADSVPLGSPITLDLARRDSSRAAASGGYRRAETTAVEGYQTRDGWLVIQRPDSATVSARFEGTFVRTGALESVSIAGSFGPMAPVEDTTLCAVPRTTPDTGVNLSR